MAPLMPSRMLLSQVANPTQTLERRVAALEKVVQVAADGSVTISATKITIKGVMAVEIAADVAVTVKGGASVALNGAMVKLNNGGRPLARLGDPVVVGGGTGVITAGSATILA